MKMASQNINLIKYRIKLVLHLLCFIQLFLVIPLAQAQETPSEKPYKATTVDECVQEKECVWYAFDLLVTQDYQDFGTGTVLSAEDNVKIRQETRKKWKLVKWLRSPIVALIGNQSKKEILKIEQLVKKVQPSFY